MVFFYCSCDKFVHPTIPEVSLDFTILPDDPNYGPLNHYGGYMYFTGGVEGVIVYRVDGWTFKAYDRACPYDWQDINSWNRVDESGIIVIDTCCGSRFNILDGTVINGPANYPLKYYRTNYDGRRLRIYN
ncbi:MAG: hypothetical protein LBU51_07235 [Bacteroidales bacterium]|nr:hypothetical protein [Bacteroidales bacterium]